MAFFSHESSVGAVGGSDSENSCRVTWLSEALSRKTGRGAVTDSKTSTSFIEFFRETEPRLRHALVAAFGVEAGSEATSEALAFGWEHWDSVSQRPNPAGYLFGVGRNKARRRVSRRRLFPIPPTEHDFVVEPELPKALGRLSEKQRIAVLLVHGDDWTHAEVAEFLGVSLSTVQTHVERGMSKLRMSIGVKP